MTIGEPSANADKRTYVFQLTKLLPPDSTSFPYGHVVSFESTITPGTYTWASPTDWDDAAQSIVDGLTAAGWDVAAIRRDALDATITPSE